MFSIFIITAEANLSFYRNYTVFNNCTHYVCVMMRLIGGEGKKHLTANNYYWQTQFPALIGKLRLYLATALLLFS